MVDSSVEKAIKNMFFSYLSKERIGKKVSTYHCFRIRLPIPSDGVFHEKEYVGYPFLPCHDGTVQYVL